MQSLKAEKHTTLISFGITILVSDEQPENVESYIFLIFFVNRNCLSILQLRNAFLPISTTSLERLKFLSDSQFEKADSPIILILGGRPILSIDAQPEKA